jgi:hypothetical protein
MTLIPLGTKYLVITLESKQDSRFIGINRLGRLLGKGRRFHHLSFHQELPSLKWRRNLQWVLINGHGPEDAARISSGDLALQAGQLLLPPDTHLYLTACYQGREATRRQWANMTGLPAHQVHGSENETESALTTLLFLNLLWHGPEIMSLCFERWQEANSFYLPQFPLIRRVYEEAGRQFKPAMAKLRQQLDLNPFKDFIQPAMAPDMANYLNDLG